MTEGPTPSRVHTPWMVWAFVVFALLLVAAWIRLLTIDAPAQYDGANGKEWSDFARTVMGTAFSACVGGSLVCVACAVTCLARPATSNVERGLWLLAAPAVMFVTWMEWWYEALGVGA